MKTYIALFAEAFLFSFVLTPIAIYLFERLGLVDRPDGVRKLHATPVPRLGGLVLTFSIAMSLGSLWMVANEAGWQFRSSADTLSKLLVPALLILVVGIIDDLRPLPSLWKFGLQVVAASIVWFRGVSFTLNASQIGGNILLDLVGYVLTVLWIVGLTNAFNLIDGLDGLAAGVAFLASTTLLVSALAFENHTVAILMLPVCGALLGFLRYNFNPARIFLGDSGSTLLGFILAVVALVYAQKRATIIAITLPFVALGLPIADTMVSVLRRLIRGAPLFQGDYGHVHHKLLNLGLIPRHAVIVLYGISLVFSVLALVAMFATTFTAAVVISAFCVMVVLGVRVLQYQEFQAAPRLFRTELQGVRNQIALKDLCDEMQQATSLEQITGIIGKIAALFAFDGFRLKLSRSLAANLNAGGSTVARDFQAPSNPFTHPEKFWLLTLPLGVESGDGEGETSLMLYQEIGPGRVSFQADILIGSLVPALGRGLQHAAASAAGGMEFPTAAGSPAGTA